MGDADRNHIFLFYILQMQFAKKGDLASSTLAGLANELQIIYDI